MKKIHVIKAFDWHERWDYILAHSAGYEIEVSEECAAHAVGRGYAMFSDIAEDELISTVYENEAIEDEANRAIVQTAHDEALQDQRDGL